MNEPCTEVDSAETRIRTHICRRNELVKKLALQDIRRSVHHDSARSHRLLGRSRSLGAPTRLTITSTDCRRTHFPHAAEYRLTLSLWSVNPASTPSHILSSASAYSLRPLMHEPVLSIISTPPLTLPFVFFALLQVLLFFLTSDKTRSRCSLKLCLVDIYTNLMYPPIPLWSSMLSRRV